MNERSIWLALPLALAFSLVSPGDFWRSLLIFLPLSAFILWTLQCLSQGSRRLLTLMLIAFFLRAGAGVFLEQVLPFWGHPSPTQRNGYLYYDAYRRDNQAWELAVSDQPLTLAFSRETYTDQYGGLLFVSALGYRVLSPDAHRALLIVLLGAWMATLGLPFLWKLAETFGPPQLAWLAGLWYALYPEAILQGAAQMREPFLMSAVLWLTWGGQQLLHSPRRRKAWAALAGGLFLLLTFSPGIAAFALPGLALFLLVQTRGQRSAWLMGSGAIVLALLALALFTAQAAGDTGNLAARALTWLKLTIGWDVHLLEQQSGWVQKLLGELPGGLRLPFVAGFGLAQPALPATLLEPSVPLWHVLNFLRSAGWYVLVVPLLIAVPVAWQARKTANGRALLVLALLVWGWVVLASLRAGGDLWDNPRYRVIFLGWQALVAAWGWLEAQRQASPWRWRVISAEVIFLLFFGDWYLSRYTGLVRRLPFWEMVAGIWLLTFLAWGGEWFWRYWRKKQPHR